MRLTVNALKRLLGMGLAIALVATAPTALAANDDGQDGDVDKPDFTLYAVADPINTLWALTTTGRVTIDGRSALLSDEAAQKKAMRKSIKDLFPEDLIEKHTGGRDINALSLDELVQLKDGLTEYRD